MRIGRLLKNDLVHSASVSPLWYPLTNPGCRCDMATVEKGQIDAAGHESFFCEENRVNRSKGLFESWS